MKTYREERLRLARRAVQDRSRIERRIDEVTREIERLVDAIAKGLGNVELLGPRSKALNQERKQLESHLANTQEPPNVVALHPQALKQYEEMIERMQSVLSGGVKTGDMDASAVIRELVETVTVYRDDSRPGGVQVEITGRLNSLLGDQAFPNGIRAVGGLMVAEVRFDQSPRHATALFSFRSN